MPKHVKDYEAHAEKLRLLREAYQRDLDAGYVASVEKKKRKKKRWYVKRPTVIHKRPDAGLWKWLRLKVWERDGWTCQYCGSKRELQVDHVMPISKGGSNKLKNLVTACRECNKKKMANVLPPEKWQVVRTGILDRYYRSLRLREEAKEMDRTFSEKVEAEERRPLETET